MDYAAIMRIPLLVMVFLLSLSARAEVYRSVDEDGNVIFSDQPSPGAEKIKLDKIQTIDAPRVKPLQTDSGNKKAETDEAYKDVAIRVPANEESISANDGNLTVNVSVTPALQTKKGHQVALFLDGKEMARGTDTQLQLSNIDRGTHKLTAAVIDENGSEIKRSDTIQFTIHRHSVQHPESTVGRPATGAPPGPTGGAPGPAGGTPGPTGGAPAPAP